MIFNDLILINNSFFHTHYSRVSLNVHANVQYSAYKDNISPSHNVHCLMLVSYALGRFSSFLNSNIYSNSLTYNRQVITIM